MTIETIKGQRKDLAQVAYSDYFGYLPKIGKGEIGNFVNQVTQDALRRPDLEQIETNPVIGYIGTKIMPTVKVMQKGGTVYYQALTADAAAQTNRNAGSAFTRVLLSKASTTYTAAETGKEYAIDKYETENYGGIEIVDYQGAMAAKRSVERAVEEAVADIVLTNGTVSGVDIGSSLIGAVETGLESIRRYSGRTAFVCSKTIFHRIMKYSEVTGYFGLSSASISGADAMAIVSRQPAALKMILSSILGVDEILIGDDDQWYDSDVAKQDRAALIKLPSTDPLSFKTAPEFGRNFVYYPSMAGTPFEIESYYDSKDKVNAYTCAIWNNLVELNSNALYILDGLDAGNTITT